jgi:outer membrane receptor protein involved in Fe transport
MASASRSPVAAIVASILCAAHAAGAAEDGAARPSSYPAAYFASMQPYSAFDMVAATPGFALTESDPDVRGLAGAVGNVLIDGVRPATKQESLEAALRRIPASAVDRIELIRAGAPGVDMQGHSLLANVVRARRARTAGALEAASTFYDGFTAPRTAGEWTRETQAQRLEVSAAVYRQVGDEHGAGQQPRKTRAGALVEDSRYAQDERERLLELAGALEQRLPGGMLRANGSFARERSRAAALEAQVFPTNELESDLELERQRETELGVQYEHTSPNGLQLEWLGLYRRKREVEREDSVERADRSSFEQHNDASEAIVRGRVHGSVGRATIEAGVEAARNVLDGRSALDENGVAIALPAAEVRIEERRAEAFALASFQPAVHWTLEGGARFEYSVLEQSGDSSVRKAFFFPKPRMLLIYAPADSSQWRMLIERRVGQLDFEDFVSSTSLSVDTVSAGNPDLEPDRSWTAELAWERQWRPDVSLVLAVRREWISDLVDRRPIVAREELLDGVGNIGDGLRDELELSVSAPLAALGLGAARVKATGLWRSGEARDPTTGRRRAISDDLPFEGAVRVTHDLPALKIHWGVDAEFGREARQFMLDEVRVERLGTQLEVFAEYTPTPVWNVRVAASNLTDREFERERWIYDGPRGAAPLSYIETRTLRMGPYYTLSVRRSFGR